MNKASISLMLYLFLSGRSAIICDRCAVRADTVESAYESPDNGSVRLLVQVLAGPILELT